MREQYRAGNFDRVFNNHQKDARVKAETQKVSVLVVGALAFLTLVMSLLYLVSQPAAAQSMAYKQAIAEAAAKDRDLASFYQSNAYVPVWTRDDAVGQARRQALFRAIENVEMHGLPVARYDTQTLMTTLQEAQSTRDLGFAEVAMSQMFLRLSRDMQTGLLTPIEVDFNIKREIPYRDRQALLAQFQAGDPFDYFRTLAPQSNEYARLMKAKLQLETRVAEGGWGETVPAKSLNPGATGSSVVALRNRLVRMGYMPRSVTQSYDRGIEAAVRRFQELHGLEPDGVADEATLKEINVSAADRLKSVIVAMERERWLNLPGGKGERHILVNLTDFSARIMDNDNETFRTRAVIGMHKDGRRSPEFSDEMEHMVINPTWHVPRSIAVKEYLPKLRANPNALGHLRVVNSRGQTVSRGSANFAAYSAKGKVR
ncbi:MAG: peptidoglycan-binding protein, partial [Pseudomonadota bacterium]